MLFGSDDWDDCGIARGYDEENGGNASDLDDDDSFSSTTFQEPMGDTLSHRGTDSNMSIGMSIDEPEPATRLPPPPPAILPPKPNEPPPPPAILPPKPLPPPTDTTPPKPPPVPVQPSNGDLEITDADLDIPEDANLDIPDGQRFVDQRPVVEDVEELKEQFLDRPGVSPEVAEAAAVNMHNMEEEVAELSESNGGVIAKTHRGFMGGMFAFFSSWWGMLVICFVLLGLVTLLLLLWSRRGKSDKHTHPVPVPSHSDVPAPTLPPKPSNDEVIVYLAWEANREPTLEDKIVLFNVGSPDIAWSCCAQAIFKSHKEVHVRLPPGNYAARTIHKNGMQQVCSLETSRRVAFTDAATRCSQAVSSTSQEINLGVCDTLVTN